MTTNNPTPDSAYAQAPSIIREITWVAGEAAAYRVHRTQMGLEFWLRKAAVLDRVALDETDTFAPEVASEAALTAEKAAAPATNTWSTPSATASRNRWTG